LKHYIDLIQSKISSLEAVAQQALKQATKIKQFKKGEYLLNQGEVCNGGYLIQSGAARKFYLNDGKEITTELFFKNDLAVSHQSYTLQTASHEYIQAIEKVTASYSELQINSLSLLNTSTHNLI
jgi:CRP-like cAMP-binding protein